jgi:hypothetical protein
MQRASGKKGLALMRFKDCRIIEYRQPQSQTGKCPGLKPDIFYTPFNKAFIVITMKAQPPLTGG